MTSSSNIVLNPIISVKDTHRYADACFLLHCYDYSESSLIAEVFSYRYGRLTLMAKGAKRPQSHIRSILLHFQPLELHWFGKNTLKTLSKAYWSAAPIVLQQASWMGAWYCNELILNVLASEDPHPSIFEDYQKALRLLEMGGSVSFVLRWFEWQLLKAIGLAFDPTVTQRNQVVDPNCVYWISPLNGVEEINHTEESSFLQGVRVQGLVLEHIGAQAFAEPTTEKAVKQVLRLFIEHALQGKTLQTRKVFQGLHKKGGEDAS